MFFSRTRLLFLCVGTWFFLSSCEKPSPSTTQSDTELDGAVEDDGNDTNTDPTIDEPVNGALQLEFDDTAPAHMAVSSPTSQVSADTISSGQIALPSALQLNSSDGGSSNSKGYASKIEAIQKVLAAASINDCMAAVPSEFSFAQGNLNHAQCFGPAVTLTNHPELDSQTSAGGIGAGDAGMFWDYAEPSQTSGEACGARVIDNVINNVGAYADAGLGFHAMTACAATVSKTALPEISSSVDLSASLSALDMAGQNFDISSATIEREQDAENGDAVFVTKISGWMKDVPRDIQKNFTLQVRHITGTFDATEYSGSLKFIVEDFEDGNDLAVSIRYAWSSAQLKYRYRQAQISSATDSNFSTDHEVSTSSATGASKWTEIISNNDKNGLGKIAIMIWNSDLNIFNAETKADGTGVAYFGHKKAETADFDSSEISLISGFKCLPINPPPPGTDPFSGYVQRQTFKLASDGAWGLDQSNIAYAPISTCNWTASEDASGSATFVAQNDGHTKTLVFPLENSLYPKADYSSSWVAPALP